MFGVASKLGLCVIGGESAKREDGPLLALSLANGFENGVENGFEKVFDSGFVMVAVVGLYQGLPGVIHPTVPETRNNVAKAVKMNEKLTRMTAFLCCMPLLYHQ